MGWTVRMGLVAAALGVAGPGAAQTAPAGRDIPLERAPAHTAAPVVRAASASGGPRVDGRLDDVAWAAAVPATGFLQLDPREGEPASESTEVRVLLDGGALHVGARLFDREPGRIVARLARRDEVVGSDLFEVLIDPRHDHLTAYAFGVTAGGARQDGQVGADGVADLSWDGAWQAAATRDSLGWSVELRIPLSQLRYAETGDPTWGIQFRRFIQRRQETAVFAFTPKSEQGGASRFGHLVGLGALPVSRGLELLPHVVGRLDRAAGAASAAGSTAGFDATWHLSRGFTLDATVNPDFGQVDQDPAQVNLTAFELFFPERRPFFVQGAEVFRFGGLGAFATLGAGNVTYFHSRRVGRAPQRALGGVGTDIATPDETSILGAAKLTGRTAGGWSLGLLSTVTARELGAFTDVQGSRRSAVVEPFSSYVVARVSRELRAGATAIGGLVTGVQRDLADSALAGLLRRGAWVAGLDVHHGWDQRRWRVDASVAASRVSGSREAITLAQRSNVHNFQRPDARHVGVDTMRTSLSGYHAQLALTRTAGQHWLGSVALQATSPGFEANDLGFHRRSDLQAATGFLAYKVDAPTRLLRRWQLSATARNAWNEAVLGFAQGILRLNATLANYWGASAEARYYPRYSDDRLSRGGPRIVYSSAGGMALSLESDPRRPFGLSGHVVAEWDSSGFDDRFYSLELVARPRPALELRLRPEVQDARHPIEYVATVTDPAQTRTYGRRYIFGDLNQTVVSLQLRASWTFTPALSLQLFAQPLLAAGRYTTFQELRRPSTFEFDVYGRDIGTVSVDTTTRLVTVDPDGSGATPAFTFGDPTFNERSLRLNVVLRWEFRPGSTMLLVWQQERHGSATHGRFDLGDDWRTLASTPGDNVVVLKVSYWIGR